MRTKTLIFSLAAVFILGLGLLFYVIGGNHDEAVRKEVNSEIVRHLLDLEIVIIIGSGIAAIFKAHESWRADLRSRMEARADYIRRLGKMYRSVKSSRRLLRTAGLTFKYAKAEVLIKGEIARIYIERMNHINDVQLELEGLKIEIGSLSAFYAIKNGKEELGKMENYLRGVLHEYEEVAPGLSQRNDLEFRTLKRLCEFTGSAGKGSVRPVIGREREKGFKHEFSIPYATLVEAISKTSD